MTTALLPALSLLALLAMSEPAPATGADADGDGVGDIRDACPQTPQGYPVSPDGCALDGDKDGVADGADDCPATRPGPGGIDEGIDAHGCSVRDRKRDRDFPYSLGVG